MGLPALSRRGTHPYNSGVSPAPRLRRSSLAIAVAASLSLAWAAGAVAQTAPAAPVPTFSAPGAAAARPIAAQGQDISPSIGALALPSLPTLSVSAVPSAQTTLFAAGLSAVSGPRAAAADLAAAKEASLPFLPEAKAVRQKADRAAAAPARRAGRAWAAETLRAIAVSKLPALLFDGAGARWSAAADPVLGDDTHGPSAAGSLAAFEKAPAKSAEPPQADSFSWRPKPEERLRGELEVRERSWLERLVDKASYRRAYLSSFFWRVTQRTTSTWEHFREKGERVPEERRAVPDLRGFFLDHLIIGSTGRLGMFGLRVTDNRIVFGDSWNVFNRYYREDRASTEAFARLLARAQHYNPNRRATQFRKIVQTALKDGAVRDLAELPAFFNGVVAEENAKALADYQKTRMTADLEALDRLVKETILEINRGARKGERIAGALLMGSFANGAAGPSSDLDLQVATEDGEARHLPAFYARLQDRWDLEGKPNPIGGFQYALPMSKRFIDSMHYEPYLLFSPYPEVIEKLQRSAAEDASKTPSRVRGLSGDAYHIFYRGLLSASIFVDEIWGKLTHRPPRPPDH